MMILKQWFGLCQCRGALHSPVSCWADCSFQSNTEDDRGKSVMPIRVPREKEKKEVGVVEREKKQKKRGTG